MPNARWYEMQRSIEANRGLKTRGVGFGEPSGKRPIKKTVKRKHKKIPSRVSRRLPGVSQFSQRMEDAFRFKKKKRGGLRPASAVIKSEQKASHQFYKKGKKKKNKNKLGMYRINAEDDAPKGTSKIERRNGVLYASKKTDKSGYVLNDKFSIGVRRAVTKAGEAIGKGIYKALPSQKENLDKLVDFGAKPRKSIAERVGMKMKYKKGQKPGELFNKYKAKKK